MGLYFNFSTSTRTVHDLEELRSETDVDTAPRDLKHFDGKATSNRHRTPALGSAKRSYSDEYRSKPIKDVGYILGEVPNNFFRVEFTAILSGHVLCKRARAFGTLRETLLRDVPMYKLKSSTDVAPETFLNLHRAILTVNSRTSIILRSSELDPQKLCCFRVAQLGLSHSLLRKPVSKGPLLDKEEFMTELRRVMSLKLSPSYLGGTCKSYGTVTSGGIPKIKVPKRCFTWKDLRPRGENTVIFEDLVPVLNFFGALISISSMCFIPQRLGFCMRLGRVKLNSIIFIMKSYRRKRQVQHIAVQTGEVLS